MYDSLAVIAFTRMGRLAELAITQAIRHTGRLVLPVVR
jgi:hypothetical protein